MNFFFQRWKQTIVISEEEDPLLHVSVVLVQHVWLNRRDSSKKNVFFSVRVFFLLGHLPCSKLDCNLVLVEIDVDHQTKTNSSKTWRRRRRSKIVDPMWILFSRTIYWNYRLDKKKEKTILNLRHGRFRNCGNVVGWIRIRWKDFDWQIPNHALHFNGIRSWPRVTRWWINVFRQRTICCFRNNKFKM